MQVKIRLQRFGSKKRPFYRIIATASAKKRDGRFLDILGLYHPVSAPESQIRLDDEKVKKWLQIGAVPSDTVKNILTKKGLWKEFAQVKEAKRVEKIKRSNKASKENKPKTEKAVKE
ncbi:MAG: 30S ribosomal protein S16 [Spirochaetia bacterium]|nr:30S ribosomal protein S16 [Spirochaetia bacterium]